MHPITILVAEHDPAIGDRLASSLDRHFRSVRVVHSLDEAISAIPRHRVDAVVADLETLQLNDVSTLSREHHIPFICTHRIPDEDMWTAALGAGAMDVCQASDVTAIVSALSQNLPSARSTAA